MSHANPHKVVRQHGLTLVEILIAITLSLLLTAGVILVFLSSKQAYRSSNAISQMQDAGRFALHALVEDIRLAGYAGCADPDTLDDLVWDDRADHAADFPGNALIGTNNDGANNSDSITLTHGAPTVASLSADMSSASDKLTFGEDPGVRKDNVAIIADCGGADIFQVTNDPSTDDTVEHDATDNATNQFVRKGVPYSYQQGSRLMMRVTSEYKIKDTGQKANDGSPIYALYQGNDELVDGVENLQIQYGLEDPDTKTVQYVSWNNVSWQWSTNPATVKSQTGEMISVRIGVLVSSIDNNAVSYDDNSTYNVAGVSVVPAGGAAVGPTHPVDKRIRRVFTTTVKLRNRGDAL
jgi:type IV pilus assembly protein PilW